MTKLNPDSPETRTDEGFQKTPSPLTEVAGAAIVPTLVASMVVAEHHLPHAPETPPGDPTPRPVRVVDLGFSTSTTSDEIPYFGVEDGSTAVLKAFRIRRDRHQRLVASTSGSVGPVMFEKDKPKQR
jgi:hypothetical protein